ncbi:MAG: Npt1/Npt2 family nucleotide transporter, partial [Pseudomonadota bacterium]
FSTVVLALFGGNIIRYFSWYYAAITTPIIFSVLGLLMFGIIMLEDMNLISTFMPMLLPAAGQLIQLIVFLGFIQHVIGKGCKYSLLDSCKEMSYIPLEQKLKTKGKASVDVVCQHLGKLSGAFVQSMLFMIFPMSTYEDPKIVKILFAVFLVLAVLWINSVRSLNRGYQQKLAEHEASLDEQEAKAKSV